jgi:carbon-monoxide dehydrogenase medium subunit
MIPSAFDYEVAGSIDEAFSLLKDGGEDAKLLAGGHSLLPLMKLRLARPSLLIDIGRLSDLSYIREEGERIAIGALTRHHDLEHSELLGRLCPIIAHTAAGIGDPQVRHRGTIGGSVAHGDPASDFPPVLRALDAEFVARGSEGERTIAASDMFTGLFETALKPDELLAEIRVPKLDAKKHAWSYQKFHRRAQDWAIVGVAAVLEKSNGGIGSAAIGLTNMGSTPLRAAAVESALAGAKPDDVAGAANKAADGTSPPADTNGSSDYRKHLARVLTRRAVEEALNR